MSRPTGTAKDRLPIMEDDYERIMTLAKKDKSIKQNTKRKLLRYFTFLYATGARVSEIVNLTIKDLQLIYQHKQHILTKTKTKTIQRLVFNDKSIEMLKALEFGDCNYYLFYKNNSRECMSVQGATKLINKYLAKYLNILYTSHSFRAGFVTRIMEATGNPRTAQTLARHSSIKTTMMYASTTPKQIDDALDKIF